MVLYRAASGWSVVFPEEAIDATRLKEFPQEEARDDIGRQRWAIALPDSLPDDLDWSTLQEEIMVGCVPVVSLDIDVHAA